MIRILALIAILLSFSSAFAAEFGCLCLDDVATHSMEQVEAHSHSHDDQSTKADHTNHCHHSCNHHVVTLEPKILLLRTNVLMTVMPFITTSSSPRAVSQSLYRPPIA